MKRAEHTLETFLEGELNTLRGRLASYDLIGAVEVRALSANRTLGSPRSVENLSPTLV